MTINVRKGEDREKRSRLDRRLNFSPKYREIKDLEENQRTKSRAYL